MGFNIGSAELRHGLTLAPMAGVTDRHFRRVCGSLGAEYAVTEMVSAKAVCYDRMCRKSIPSRSAPLARIDGDGIPTAVQLFGSEPEFMREAAVMIESLTYPGAEGARPAAIDINMGCPVRKVVACGEGSALMKNPGLAGRIISAVVSAVSLPVTVKLRAGWDGSSVNAPEIARIAEASGAAAVCIHARTREQFYAPSADYRVIEKVKRAVGIPVIGNGDIFSAGDALRMLGETGCDGVAVARGALGNPWIFSEIRAALDKRDYSPPDRRERIETALAQLRAMLSEKGARAISEARGQLSWYIRGFPGAAAARDALNRASELSELEAIMYSLID